jgi:hypothetical protein
MVNERLFKTDDGAALRFYEEAEQNNFASQSQGRAIFDQVLYVEVITPGSRESAPVFICERLYAPEVGIAEPARTEYYDRFRKQIEAYRDGTTGVALAGTPLEAWPRMTVALIATLRACGVFTIEGLAEVSDGNLSKIGPGARELRSQAQTFIKAASGNAESEKLAAENVQLREELEQLKSTVAQLAASTTTAETAPPPPPPPPPVQPPAKAAKAGGGNASII